MSETPMALEVNCETGESITRPLTAEELAASAAYAAAWEAEQAALAAEAAARATARAALLTRLGITEQEAQLLLS